MTFYTVDLNKILIKLTFEMMAILEIPYRTLYHTPENTNFKVILFNQVENSKE